MEALSLALRLFLEYETLWHVLFLLTSAGALMNAAYPHLNGLRLETPQKRKIIFLLYFSCVWAACLIVEHGLFPLAYKLTAICWEDGQAAFLLLYLFFVPIVTGLAFSLGAWLFDAMDFRETKKNINLYFLSSCYLPTVLGVLAGFLTDCFWRGWWAWANHEQLGSFVYAIPYLPSLYFQVNVLDKLLLRKPKKKSR